MRRSNSGTLQIDKGDGMDDATLAFVSLMSGNRRYLFCAIFVYGQGRESSHTHCTCMVAQTKQSIQLHSGCTYVRDHAQAK